MMKERVGLMALAARGMGWLLAIAGGRALLRWWQGKGHFRLPGGAVPGTALITGASSGIGAAFARRLAAEGYDLILVARREERLRSLAERIRQESAMAVEVVVADLSSEEGIRKVEEVILGRPELTLLINNAGFGTTGTFAGVALEKHLRMIRLQVEATARLMHAALPAMIASRRGGIINVSSIVAIIPRPGSANYSATKAYMASLSRTVQGEVREYNVRVQALCPGFTYTGFHDSEEYADFEHSQIPAFLWSRPEEVVDASLAALMRGDDVCIPGWPNKLMVAMTNSGLISPLFAVYYWLRGRE